MFKHTMVAGAVVLAMAGSAQAARIVVKVENLSPINGLFLTPMWVGFHNGSFDLYDPGSPVSAGLERLVEDGPTGFLSAEFAASGAGIDATIGAPGGFPGAPVIDAGESVSREFTVDAMAHRYFSYASMVIPSNDAFIANGNPLAHQLFDAAGNFRGTQLITILGSRVLDAGSEVNTEMDAAFINQMADDAGIAENGGVMLHSGFNGSLGHPGGVPLLLGGTNAAGSFVDPVLADFTQPDYALARITISAVPEPGTYAMFGAGLGLLLMLRRKHRV